MERYEESCTEYKPDYDDMAELHMFMRDFEGTLVDTGVCSLAQFDLHEGNKMGFFCKKTGEYSTVVLDPLGQIYNLVLPETTNISALCRWFRRVFTR